MLRRVLPTMLLLATTWLVTTVTTGCGSNAGNEPESTNRKPATTVGISRFRPTSRCPHNLNLNPDSRHVS